MALGAAAAAILVLATVFGILMLGLVSLCLWKGAIWWLEQQGHGSDDFLDRVGFERMPKGVHHADWHSSRARRRQKAIRTAGESGSAVPTTVTAPFACEPQPQPLVQSAVTAQVASSSKPAGVSVQLETPVPISTANVGSAQCACDEATAIQVSMVAPPSATSMEDLQIGLASKLANAFRGNHEVHAKNVGTVTCAFGLQPSDLCYCFLVLEEIVAVDQGLLSVKVHGVGPYSARLWVTILARFVRAAQMDVAARDEVFLQALCDEWSYSASNFIYEVTANEERFFRKHGQRLIGAFQLESVRLQELARARRSLAALAAASAPPRHRQSPGGPQHAALPQYGSNCKNMALPWAALPGVDPRVVMQPPSLQQPGLLQWMRDAAKASAADPAQPCSGAGQSKVPKALAATAANSSNEEQRATPPRERRKEDGFTPERMEGPPRQRNGKALGAILAGSSGSTMAGVSTGTSRRGGTASKQVAKPKEAAPQKRKGREDAMEAGPKKRAKAKA